MDEFIIRLRRVFVRLGAYILGGRRTSDFNTSGFPCMSCRRGIGSIRLRVCIAGFGHISTSSCAGSTFQRGTATPITLSVGEL